MPEDKVGLKEFEKLNQIERLEVLRKSINRHNLEVILETEIPNHNPNLPKEKELLLKSYKEKINSIITRYPEFIDDRVLKKLKEIEEEKDGKIFVSTKI